MVVGWSVSAIMTAAGALTDDPSADEYKARTDGRLGVIGNAKWFYVAYPGNQKVSSGSPENMTL